MRYTLARASLERSRPRQQQSLCTEASAQPEVPQSLPNTPLKSQQKIPKLFAFHIITKPGRQSAQAYLIVMEVILGLTNAATPPAITKPSAELLKLLMPPLSMKLFIGEGVDVGCVAAAVPFDAPVPVA